MKTQLSVFDLKDADSEGKHQECVFASVKPPQLCFVSLCW